MFKKAMSGLAALVLTAVVALGAGLPFQSGPQDPSQLQASTNALVNTINGYLGTLSAQYTSVSSVATNVETVLTTFTVPTNTVVNNGGKTTTTCWGTFGANLDSKTIKIYFGGIVASANTTNQSGPWQAQLTVTRTGSTNDSAFAFINMGVATTAVMNSFLNVQTGSDVYTGAITTKCAALTAGTSGDIVLNGMTVEVSQ